MFKQRSDKKELLDGEHIPRQDLFRNLKELNVINNLLGGYRVSFNMLCKVLDKEKECVVVDIGSGGGDTLKQIEKWNKQQHYKLRLVGIDIKPDCVAYARENNDSAIEFICDDYKNIHHHIAKADIVHACLFCHHLSNQEIIGLIHFCHQHNITLIINDLERNGFAYYAIKVLTSLFSRSYLVKNDAPLSVLRGFRSAEWQYIIQQAGIKNYSLQKKWAFRHEIIIYASDRTV